MLITQPLASALSELQKNISLLTSPVAREHPKLVPTFRTAAIKSFEYVYELSIKLIRRQLERMAASESEVDQMEFRTLLRTAAEKGLVDDPLPWLLFREKSIITSHTYDETMSMDVFAVLPQFVPRAQILLDRLRAAEEKRL